MIKKPPVSIVLSAISGYGYYYLQTLFEECADSQIILRGVVDPQPEKSALYGELLKRKIPVFPDFQSFYKDGQEADLAVIASPPHFHLKQSIEALEHGAHVLVEKPVGLPFEGIDHLLEVRNRVGRWVEVGFQWSFSSPIQEMKRDILSGRFGLPIQAETHCFWPRPQSYYRRNGWAGRIHTDEGQLVLDSPVNNACAHFLHNVLFLLGPEMDRAAKVAGVAAHCYRAYKIESFDTVKGVVFTEQSGPIRFAFSHVTEKTVDPSFSIRFENAEVRTDPVTREIVATRNGILIRNYGSPDADHQFKKLFHAIQGVMDPIRVVCPPEAVRPHAEVVYEIYKSLQPTEKFDNQRIVDTGKRRWVKGLEEELLNDE